MVNQLIIIQNRCPYAIDIGGQIPKYHLIRTDLRGLNEDVGDYLVIDANKVQGFVLNDKYTQDHDHDHEFEVIGYKDYKDYSYH